MVSGIAARSARLPLHVLTISTSLPRRCGIATFNGDLSRELTSAGVKVTNIALRRGNESHVYPDSTVTTIAQDSHSDYLDAARFINRFRPDAVLLEHEFGIYGGQHGSYIVDLLAHLKVPVVTLVHTYPFTQVSSADKEKKAVLQHLGSLSVSVSTISQVVQQRLTADFRAINLTTPVVHIPHGTPDLKRFLLRHPKHALGLEDTVTLATFGLIGPGKGIDQVISALPEIVARHPQVVYYILGAPHPADQQAKKYLAALHSKVQQLELTKHVEFVTRFLSVPEIMHYLQATDVYITFYRDPDQASSGTLAYAVAAGCCVVSTPYLHARELLANDRGVILPFGDRAALIKTLIDLLADDQRRQEYKQRALAYGRPTAWPLVGQAYLKMLSSAAVRASASVTVKSETIIEPPADKNLPTTSPVPTSTIKPTG